MFDIGWSELVVIGVVALIVIGPKELPGVIRSVGRGVAKLRTMAGEFRAQFDDAMREAELHEVKKSFDDMKSAADNATAAVTDPGAVIRDELNNAVADVKQAATGATGVEEATSSLQRIEADIRSMQAEAASPQATTPPAANPPAANPPATSPPVDASAQSEPAPKARRRKAGAEKSADGEGA